MHNMLAELPSSSLLQSASPFLKSFCGLALFFNVVVICLSIGRHWKLTPQLAALLCSSFFLLVLICFTYARRSAAHDREIENGPPQQQEGEQA
jgi:type VI protein secretion system component VasK